MRNSLPNMNHKNIGSDRIFFSNSMCFQKIREGLSILVFLITIYFPLFSLAQTNITISSLVDNQTQYQQTFVGTGNSVNVNSKTINVNGIVTLDDGANFVLIEGWTLNANDFVINTGIDSSKPEDIEDLSNYTFAMSQGSRLNITATSAYNKIRSGRVYVDNAMITYTQNSAQYQFGSFNAPPHLYFS